MKKRLIVGLAVIAGLMTGGLSCAAPVARKPVKPPVGQVRLPVLSYTIDKSGPAGGPHPGRQDFVTVNYTLTLLDGTVIDKSDGPRTFQLSRLIPAWQILVPLMRAGDSWTFYVPPAFGYGSEVVGPMPADSFLIFKLELVSISPSP